MKTSPVYRIVPAAFGLLMLALAGATASSQMQRDLDAVFIPVLVLDRRDLPVTGLNVGDFKVSENGLEQRLIYFAGGDDPISSVIVLDGSASRRDNLEDTKKAVLDFVGAMTPDDEFLVIDVNRPAGVVAEFSTDTRSVMQRVMSVRPGGPTPIFDALLRAVERLSTRDRNRRKVILVSSDGGDNTSRRNLVQLESAVGRPDIIIYSIGPPGIPDSSGQLNRLIGLTRLTGGRYFIDGTPRVGSRIARELRSQYLVGYKPQLSANDGTDRRIEIEVRQIAGGSKPKVICRPRYYAMRSVAGSGL